MKKSVIIQILVLFLGICITSINAHTPWTACMNVYADKSKGGAKQEICHHQAKLNSALNKKASSVQVPDGFNARLFKTTNYKGRFIDLQAGTTNLGSDWDNQASSVEFNNWGDGCGTLYTGASRTGSTFKVCSDANIAEGYGGKVLSIHVAPLHFFRLYKNSDFSGDWMDVRGSLNLRSDWVNQVRSMKLQHWAECAWFYNDANRGGSMFQVCDSGSFPSKWQRQASSLVVPKKMTVTAYKQANYKGASKVYKAGTHNLADGWNNAIVSVKIEVEGKMTGTS